jgi:hypothetical protein
MSAVCPTDPGCCKAIRRSLPTLADTTELLVSELMTNAIRASGGLTFGMLQKSERESGMGYDRPMWRDHEREAA